MNPSNAAQIELWNGRVGEKWAALQVSLDQMLAHATAELKARAGSVRGLRVLDIGCGTGETCAIWLEGGADASVWMGEAPFDLAVSQSGLMFFADPDAAFANVAANIRPGGRLLFTCWRAATENQWVTTPLGALRDLLPEPPPPVPHAPGPFALADRERLCGILELAGFADVAIEPFNFPVRLASEGGVEPAVRLAMQVGPSGSALAEASVEVRAVAADRLRTALAPHQQDGRVTLGGAMWVVEAVRPAFLPAPAVRTSTAW